MTVLWEHQERGLGRLLRDDAVYLAWQMGCGKTLPVIMAVSKLAAKMTLILCPKSVRGVWPAEFAKHLNGECPIIFAPEKGTVARKLAAAREAWKEADGKPFVLVLNTDAAWREPMGSALLKPTWDMVVVDEAHRASSGPRTRFYRWAQRLNAKRRVCLSGTPMAHSPLNWFPQIRFLDPTRIDKTFVQFKSRYAILGGYRVNGRAVQIVGFQNLEELEQRLAPVVDRVKKADVLDLPPVVHEDRIVELPDTAMTVYRAMEEELIAQVRGGAITATNVMVKGLRLRQIVQGEARLEDGGCEPIHDAKAAALSEILDDIDPFEPVVVFAVFHSDLDAIRRVATEAGRPVNELSGRMNDVGAKWNPRPGAVAAVQIQAGGVGVDFTSSAYAVYLGQNWSLSDYEQSLARLDRPGQTRSVTYLHVLADGTIDLTIRRALANRKSLVEAVMERLAGSYGNR